MVEATAAVFFHTKLKNIDQDWNIHGHYCATKSKNTEGKFGNLNNINMSVAHKKKPILFTGISKFKPDGKQDVITSFEE